MAPAAIVTGRACGTCTLCCKVMRIAALDKPAGEWCGHCTVGAGCSIHGRHPAECAGFHCAYLTSPALSEAWRPARSKLVVASEFGGMRLGIHVDPARPSAWREEPYYSQIKQWARGGAASLMQVVVWVRNRAIVVLPDQDLDLGPMADDDRIVLGEVAEQGRLRLMAFKMKADDPRIAGRAQGAIHTSDAG
jgi:hypothetical protein